MCCGPGLSDLSCCATAAKALKSALEGGVSGPPENVLFVATSNRRHLMPRGHAEDRGLIATAEDAEEEVSVSDRFGLWIGFPPMDQTTYLAAVQGYAARYDLGVPDLDRRALQWSQLRGARSGRVAWQFIRDLAGELAVTPSLSGTVDWRPFSVSFVVGPACRAQRLVLEVPARVVLERVISGRAAFGQLSLRALAPPPGKP